jgi:Zn-dependent protease
MSGSWPVPYIPDIATFHIGAFVAFCVSILLVVLVNAEGQAFMATLLGDLQPEAKDRFNFNAFLHLDILGTITFFVGGFGWARYLKVDKTRFAHPFPYLILSRLAGPLANFLLANIAGSLVHLLRSLEIETRVLAMVAAVNVTAAVYNILPLPPLVAGEVVAAWLEDRSPALARTLTLAGPYLLLALAFLDRLYPAYSFRPFLDAWVVEVYRFICGL